MELSILLMEQIAKLFLMIFMGYAVVKLGLLTDEDSKVLSTLVLYLIVPSVILNAFQVDYTQEKVNGLKLAGIASLLLLIILLLIVNLIGKLLNLNEVEILSCGLLIPCFRTYAVQLALASGYIDDLDSRIERFSTFCSLCLIHLSKRAFADFLYDFPFRPC